MFEIKVTVDLPGIPEAINNLVAALAGKGERAEEKATQEAVAPAVVTTPAIVAPDPVPAAPAPAPVQQAAPVAAPAPVVTAPVVTAPAPVPAPEKVYTFDEISVAGAALCNQGPEMTDRLVALLQTKYGVDSIVDLPESKYGEIALDLQSLGAKMG